MPDKITRERLEEAVNQMFKERKSSERRFKLRQYCKTNGTLVIDSASPFVDLCNDSECENCQRFGNAFKEELKKEIDKLNGV